MCNATFDAPAKYASTGNHKLTSAWTQVLGADANRRSAVVYNDGPNAIYVTFQASTGTGTGDADSVSMKMPSGSSLTVRHTLGVWACSPAGATVYVESESGVAG